MIQNKSKKVIDKIYIRPSKMIVLNDKIEVDTLRCNIANILNITSSDITFKYKDIKKQ